MDPVYKFEEAQQKSACQNYFVGKSNIYQACKDNFDAQFRETLESVFRNVDDMLFDSADKASNSQDQSLFFSAMRHFRLNQSKLLQLFFQPSAQPESNSEQITAANLDGMQLLDYHAMEESIAIDGAVKKSLDINKQALFLLEKRTAFLLDSGQDALRYFHPKTLCERYKSVIATLDFELKILLIMYKLFDKHALSKLPAIYERLNGFLAEQNVLPNLRVSTPHARNMASHAAPSAQALQPNLAIHYDLDTFDPEQSETAAVYALLNNLAGSHGTAAPLAPLAATPRPALNRMPVVTALHHLQLAYLSNESPSPVAAAKVTTRASGLRAHLLHANALPAESLDEEENKAIDVVEMLFDFVLSDRNIPPVMRALFGRLQIPILKVALLDKTFLSRKNHPARALLNEMGTAAMHWNDEKESRGGALYEKMETLIAHLITNFVADLGVFAQTLDEFREFVQQEKHYYDVVEKRTLQMCRGEDKKSAAVIRAERFLKEKMQGNHPPDAARDILQGPWRKYLVHTGILEEEELWHQATATTDLLLWSVQANPDDNRKIQLRKLLPSLISDIRRGFSQIGLDDMQIKNWLARLEQCHMSLLSTEKYGDVQGSTNVAKPKEGRERQVQDVLISRSTWMCERAERPLHQIEQPAPAIESNTGTERETVENIEEIVLQTTEADPEQDAFVHQVQDLTEGTWLGFLNDNGQAQRLKLSWRSKVSDKFVFVNRKGVKVLEKSRFGLATELRRGSAFVLEELPLLDRAIDAIIGSLRNTSV